MQRRQWLQGAILAGLADSAARATAPGSVGRNFLRQYRKLRFALHEDVLFWWIRGTKLGVVDSLVTPLYHMEIASIFRCRNGAGGEFSVTSLELVYNTDIASGALLTQWRNPYTSQVIDTRAPQPIGPVTVQYTAAGPQLPTSLPGATLKHEHRWAFRDGAGDMQLLQDESFSVVTPTAGGAHEFKVSDLSTYQASRRDLDNPRLQSAPATVSFNAVSNWQRWMSMGDRPGSLLSRGVGQKARRLQDCPRPFLDLLARQHPDILRDPAAALARPPAQFDR
jgi:hypothetical protein